MAKKTEEEMVEGAPICENEDCGAVMEQDDDGNWYCPVCSVKIDYFGDEED